MLPNISSKYTRLNRDIIIPGNNTDIIPGTNAISSTDVSIVHRTNLPKSDKPNTPVKTYEFMGPVGTFIMTLGLPLVVYCLITFCNSDQCSVRPPPYFPCLDSLWNPHAYTIFMLWFIFHILIYISPLGKTVKGTLLRNGTRLRYKINGCYAFLIAHVLFIIGYFFFKLPVTIVYDRFLALACAAAFFSFTLSTYLYIKSHDKNALLALGGNTGNFIYDWFMGRELNPRLGIFDWKVFCEMRPGLIGWVMINYCMMAKQYEIQGAVSPSMVLVCLFQMWYILDALLFEASILTTMDVVHDGFGFMLVFGDMCWVPFTYSLQARFLVDYPTSLSPLAAFLILIINIIGYSLFRGSNSQKNMFRCNPDHPSVQHLVTMPTDRGTKLIISGWWSFCRHPNYLGDLIMAVAWSLPCGFSHIIPYFYFIYFTALLIHRQIRDEHHCKKKYGKDWDRYCKIIKWRLIPGVY